MTAYGGQTSRQAVATAIVCLFYASSALAEVCDKGGWDPAMGHVTLAGTIASLAAWSAGLAFLLSIAIIKRWHWLIWPIILVSIGMVLVGFSDDPKDPFIQAMIIEGCRVELRGLLDVIFFAMPLLVGAIVAALNFKLKSGTK